MAFHDQAPELFVGAMIEGGLSTRISVCNGVISIQYARGDRRVEVSYSPKAAAQMAEHILNAVRAAEGQG